MLGLDPLTVANEGKFVVIVSADRADEIVDYCRAHALGRHAAVVGHVVEGEAGMVELITRFGGRRIVQKPYGEELPRIC
jgi:hydrogenase expression/formation protein HypE